MSVLWEKTYGARDDFDRGYSYRSVVAEEAPKPNVLPSSNVVPSSSNVVLPYNIARVETLLDELLGRETNARKEELISVREELTEIRQMIDILTREMNRLAKEQTEAIDRLTTSIGELVGQSNDNATVIREIKFDSTNSRQAQSEIKSLLIQNLNGRAEEIQQLIDVSSDLLDNMK